MKITSWCLGFIFVLYKNMNANCKANVQCKTWIMTPDPLGSAFIPGSKKGKVLNLYYIAAVVSPVWLLLRSFYKLFVLIQTGYPDTDRVVKPGVNWVWNSSSSFAQYPINTEQGKLWHFRWLKKSNNCWFGQVQNQKITQFYNWA